MQNLLFIADEDELSKLQPDDNPKDSFTCMNGLGIDLEMRAQLYSLINGEFLDDCLLLEEPLQTSSDEGPWITRLPRELTQQIADLADEQLTEVVDNWRECSDVEAADLGQDDLSEYLYILTNLCQNTMQEAGLHIYTYTV
ncbi:MAG: hypothetical protein QGI68_07740 [Pseudomonadales bacterium]|jgi:hypothetical protein|nr:hypothetical protein [Pseudomonadales bacterium]MDP7595446.1 hypothetical protein [Pseudomonadales bacterium]HJN49679.1 hypothetical protein [Pseudomonadales bacterium]|tara:strand:- start:92 stop:514 length:423 start_codon:yes stop_codon:yes gene_type:complete